jgi:predicted Zn-dependent peptidase
MENIIKTYPSGLRLVVQPMPGFKSVATSIMVGAGSRDEEMNEHGLSHFVEHMLFKGTTTRTCAEIAETLSGLGVDYNAYTMVNVTCYYIRGLISNVETCCDILSDMYFNLKFKDEDFAREAEVIIQELASREDVPGIVAGELCARTFFAGTPYGHSVGGTVEDVKNFKPKDIYNYRAKHYIAPKTVISFAGNITVAKAEELVAKYFLSKFTSNAKPRKYALDANKKIVPPQNFVLKEKDIEQQNVMILFPVMNNFNEDKYKMTFVAEILSNGDMSSRLFVSVRDKLGLVYQIAGGCSLTHLGGYYYIFFSCTPENTEKALATIAEEIAKIKSGGVTEEEVAKIKNIKHSDTLFNSESTRIISDQNANLLSEFNEIQTDREYLEKINAVTAGDIKKAANKYLNFENAIVGIVGKDIKVKPFSILK